MYVYLHPCLPLHRVSRIICLGPPMSSRARDLIGGLLQRQSVGRGCSEPTKNPKMQRFENDRSAGAELSDGQYPENSWLSYVQSERERGWNRSTWRIGGRSATVGGDVVLLLAPLLPFGGGCMLPPRPVLPAPGIPCRLLVNISISKTGTGRDRRNRSNDHLGPEQLSSAAKRW
jgi:hypothetical protein